MDPQTMWIFRFRSMWKYLYFPFQLSWVQILVSNSHSISESSPFSHNLSWFKHENAWFIARTINNWLWDIFYQKKKTGYEYEEQVFVIEYEDTLEFESGKVQKRIKSLVLLESMRFLFQWWRRILDVLFHGWIHVMCLSP